MAIKEDFITTNAPREGTMAKYHAGSKSTTTRIGAAKKINTGSDFIKNERKWFDRLPIVNPKQQNIKPDVKALKTRGTGLNRNPTADMVIIIAKNKARIERTRIFEIR